jgi:hypothetical protein
MAEIERMIAETHELRLFHRGQRLAGAGFNLAFRKPQGRATTKTRERPSYEYPE